MIVTGEFEAYQDRPVLRVKTELLTPPTRSEVIKFLVDTGSERTCVFPRDAILVFGIAPAVLDAGAWDSAIVTSTAGGYIRSRLVTARFTFIDGNKTFALESTVELAESTPANSHVPSLLGWDVLRYFRTTFNGLHPFTLELLQ